MRQRPPFTPRQAPHGCGQAGTSGGAARPNPGRLAAAALLLLALSACWSSRENTAPAAPASEAGHTAFNDKPAPIRLWADRALRAAVQALADSHEARTGQRVMLVWGDTADLRQRISQGQPADIFVAAGLSQPQQLACCGQWQPPARIAQDRLCLLTVPRLHVAPATALGAMLRADVRVGAYQPGEHPLGEAFWQLMDRADQLQSGAHAAITAKVILATDSQPLQQALLQGRIDAAVQGCLPAQADAAAGNLHVTPLPAALDTGLPYTLTWRLDAPPAARDLAQTLLAAPQARAQWRALGLQTP